MDREIKFRGLRSDGKGWVFGQYISGKSLQKYKHYIIDTNGYHSEVISKSVGQFTGLKDKNGVDIYEGDLAKHGAWDYPFEIIFNDEKARFVCKMKSGFTQYIANTEIKVIGNIHEPQL